MKEIPKSTKVVVIGGGVAGCSVAYHLAKFGWKDTILFERDQLTSGTTWHAAGLVSQLGPSAAITKIRKYTTDLYKELEKKTGFSAGLKLNGALSKATIPFLIKLANNGYEKALKEDKNFLAGLNLYKGEVTYKAVADVFGHQYVSPSKAIN